MTDENNEIKIPDWVLKEDYILCQNCDRMMPIDMVDINLKTGKAKNCDVCKPDAELSIN